MQGSDSSGLWINCVQGNREQNSPKKKTRIAVQKTNKEPINNETPPKFKRKLDTKSGGTVKKKFKEDEAHDANLDQEHQPSQHPDFAIVSSLFKKNPEIPEIEERQVKQIVERMFSIQKLEDLHVHPFIISNLRQCFNITSMTAVQEKTIPVILEDKDVLVKSQTGSGKTLAYAVPIVHKLQAIEPQINRSSGLYACVVLPTRELALQTLEWFQKLLRPFTRIVSACFMGGQRKKCEKASLRRGVNILVTTPQRLIDHLTNSKKFTFSQLKYFVVDEADRLMEMGYEKNIAEILSEISKQRSESADPLVTILLSATLTQGVQKLAGLSMRNPVTIDISSEADSWGSSHLLVTPSNLQQYHLVVPSKLKLVCLMTFILWKCRGDQHKILVFMPTQDAVDYYTNLASHVTCFRNEESDDASPRDIHISRLHGNMSQQMRSEVFRDMRNAECGVLFCTDVCARGLDLPNVDWILQFGAPSSVAEYVHRVGRTARIGAQGNAVLFLLPSEVDYIGLLEQNRIKLHRMTLEDVLEALPRVNRIVSRKAKQHQTMESVEEAATSLQLECERYVESNAGAHELATKAFLSLTRAYATYPVNQRSIFNKKNLHLGHLAKCLALRDTPSNLGVGGKSLARSTEENKKLPSSYRRSPSSGMKKRNRNEVNMKSLLMAEYESGR